MSEHSNNPRNPADRMGPVDFGRTADDYTRHRQGFPTETLVRLEDSLQMSEGRVVDLGTGTGTLARQLAERGWRVTGVDVASEMLDQARTLADRAGLEIDFVNRPAEDTGLASDGFDLVIAGQCWHWFDRPQAADEARRLLRPGGRLAITHFDWIPLDDNVVAMTEATIERHNPAWTMGGGTGIYPQWFRDLGSAGFVDIGSWSFDRAVPYSVDDWRGRIRASAGIGASLEPDAVARFDEDLGRQLEDRFGADAIIEVPHRVFAVWGAKPEDQA